MRIFIVVLMLMLVPSLLCAEKYTVQSKYPDLTPGDGFMEEGSPNNPFIVRDSENNQVETISSRYDDMTQGDGLMEAGSPQNPFIVDAE